MLWLATEVRAELQCAVAAFMAYVIGGGGRRMPARSGGVNKTAAAAAAARRRHIAFRSLEL